MKVKYFDFKQVTRSITNTDWTDDSGRIMSVVNILKIKTDIGSKKVRLVGISVSNFQCNNV